MAVVVSGRIVVYEAILFSIHSLQENLNQEKARLVRDNSETFTAAEATVKKKRNQLQLYKKPVIRYLPGRNRFLVCRKKPVIQETSYQISVGAEEKKQITNLRETSYQICVTGRGRKRKQNTEVQEHKQIFGNLW